MSTGEATYAQHAVWFTEQAGVAGEAFHMAVGVWFDGDLDERALTSACTAVIARHPVLGTAVSVGVDGVPGLIPAVEKITVSRAALTEERIRAELARRFDLSRGPLARFTLLTEGPARHLLLVTAHHLVFDGMSKDILVRELAAGYDAAVAGHPVQVGPAAASAADVGDALAPARGATADADELSGAQAYWAGRWSAPGEVVLPGLLRLPVAAEPGAAVTFDLDADLADRLGKVTGDLGVTRFELLLAALYALLGRYGNVGLPVTVGLSTRTPATAHQIGLFVNELPVRVAPPVGTFRAYAHALRAELRELYPFRAVPLARAVSGGLRPAAALTPVSVGYRRRDAEPAFAGVRSRVEWAMFNHAARNALHVQIVDSPAGLTVGLQHSPAAIPTDAVVRIGAQLRTVLAAVLDDPDRPLESLPVLPADELDAVLSGWNRTDQAYPAQAGVPALFAASVRQWPDAVAVVDGARELSYAEVDAASARLAALLRARGAGPGRLVAVSLGRSHTALVALLAVMRSGAAYVPVDPTYPAPRRAYVLADAAPALVITTSPIAAQLDAGLDVLVLDDLDSLRDHARPDGPAGVTEPAGPDLLPSAGDLAYVMYTSGSTGRPKGVAVPHGALANLLLSMRDLLGSGPNDRWLGLTSLSFDISGLELYLPLITGGRLVVAPESSALDGAELHRLITTQGVTHVQATPSGWWVLLDAGGPPPVTALAGGEALPAGLARELRSRVTRLVNVYGPTETTIWSTTDDIAEGDGDQVTIGRPIANTRAYVLDGELRPVPVGVPGQLYLGGHGLADGYLRRPGLTAERFIPDPFGPVPGGRLYRTGDLCRWLPDGRISYLGRADDQVKIRGHRVELGEIEARLLEHPAVVQGAVALRPGAVDGESLLVGYVVAGGETPAPEPAELRRHLGQTLPAVMVPGVWLVLDRLPLTPNGKLDRAALPEPPRQQATEAPTGPAEALDAGDDDVIEQIRQIWQDVLQIPEIGVDEDLFDLGGHSLTITRIGGRMQQRFGVELPLEVFFDTPTIAEIAEIVRSSIARPSMGARP